MYGDGGSSLSSSSSSDDDCMSSSSSTLYTGDGGGGGGISDDDDDGGESLSSSSSDDDDEWMSSSPSISGTGVCILSSNSTHRKEKILRLERQIANQWEIWYNTPVYAEFKCKVIRKYTVSHTTYKTHPYSHINGATSRVARQMAKRHPPPLLVGRTRQPGKDHIRPPLFHHIVMQVHRPSTAQSTYECPAVCPALGCVGLCEWTSSIQ